MKKKYTKTLKIKDNKIINDNNEIITNKNLLDIISKYKPPSHLHDIELIAKSLDEADNGVVYIGLDNKNKKQYIYGVKYIKKRREYRIKIFLDVEKKIPKIEKFIKKELSIFDKEERKYNITDEVLFAIILLMELSFYIRTGKKKYMDDNETIGLLTLQKKNFEILEDDIIISFKGKLGQHQEFTINKLSNSLIYKIIKILYDNTDAFIFKNSKGNIFSESKLYKMIKKFNLKLKDIRTFGVNRILIRELWKEVQNLDIKDLRKRDIKKIVKEIVERTANIIGHTPAISKKSYILDEIRLFITTDIIKLANQIDFPDFYNYIVKELKSKNI